MSAELPGTGELRALIREVLSDLLPAGALSPGSPAVGGGLGTDAAGAASPGSPTVADLMPVQAMPFPSGPAQLAALPSGPGRAGLAQPGLAHTVRESVESVETVSLRTDADLEAFVRRLLHLLDNPKHRDALRSGRLRFRLTPGAVPGSAQPARRIDSGAVTEAMVRQAALAGARLVLGRRAVLTPLARDRARAAGVQIERER